VGIVAVRGEVLLPPEHGGDLAAAISRYGIAASDWLDLSAGINPAPYPVPAIPPQCFSRLPAPQGTLIAAARNYYAAPAAVIAAPGSQVLIQWLPLLRACCHVAVPDIGYREHSFRWRWAGHTVVEYAADDARAVEDLLARGDIDVLVAISPNNPLATSWPRAMLLQWLRVLQARQGWLVVDEAFIDVAPEQSLAAVTDEPGLIVLRSLGKFFGLAGARCGFALCDEILGAQLHTALGPWPVSGPTALVAERALRDTVWQKNARLQLQRTSAACAELLKSVFVDARVAHTGLFVSVWLSAADAVTAQEQLARTGIWVRRVELDAQRALLRFGLVEPDGAYWQRLQTALASVVESTQTFSITY
jgi:cobalamin biosynthetic protein CobC